MISGIFRKRESYSSLLLFFAVFFFFCLPAKDEMSFFRKTKLLFYLCKQNFHIKIRKEDGAASWGSVNYF